MKIFRQRLNKYKTKVKNSVPSGNTLFVGALVAWISSVVLIMAPTIGLTTSVFPPKQVPPYQLILLVVTAAIASGYSLIIGIRMIRTPKE